MEEMEMSGLRSSMEFSIGFIYIYVYVYEDFLFLFLENLCLFDHETFGFV